MSEIEFNLLDEPWIRVMTEDCTVHEISLTQALLDSHNWRCLAGELPTQDIAILRLLLAVLHTIFYRVDLEGEDSPVEDEEETLERWQMLWELGHFPEKPIRDYLERWEDRFWLFHPEHPFYQVPAAQVGGFFPAKKLNGELSESKNKARLFSPRTEEYKDSLSFAEAARWLITLLGFDDAASIKVETGTGQGWLGKHANVFATGDTLFETLMLNLVFLRDGQTLWGENVPSWEMPVPKVAKKREIPLPDNQAALLTLQSRRLLLKKGVENNVIGHYATGGDYFSKDKIDKMYCEQMIHWEKNKKKKSATLPQYVAVQPDVDKQMWQNFESIVDYSGECPFGITAWINRLYVEKILANRIIHFSSVGVTYDSKHASITDIVSDHLDFHLSLLEEGGKLWDKLIQDKIAQTEKAAWFLGVLAEALFKSAGGQPDSDAEKGRIYQASQMYYAAVDIPFRRWLASIDPDLGDAEELRAKKDEQWRMEAYHLAMKQGQKMVQNVGEAAFAGRWVEGKFYSSPNAFNRFSWQIRNHFNMKSITKEKTDERP